MTYPCDYLIFDVCYGKFGCLCSNGYYKVSDGFRGAPEGYRLGPDLLAQYEAEFGPLKKTEEWQDVVIVEHDDGHVEIIPEDDFWSTDTTSQTD